MKRFVYCENMIFYNHCNINDARYLKVGKKYEVVNIATRVNELAIKNDSGLTVTLPKSFFMDELPYLRQQKINQILK